MGLITTVSPYRGSLSPQPIYYPTPQHKYQHTYKLAYHNSITSFSISNLFIYRNYHAQTALHELVDNHVFLTSARCKWHSNPNFRGEMEWKRFVWCASRLVGASLLKFLEGFVFVSGMNALNVNRLKSHWHQWSIEAMPTYTYTQTFFIICSKHCFASHLVGEASVLTHFLRRQNWRATGVMKVIIVSTTTPMRLDRTKDCAAASLPGGCIGRTCREVYGLWFADNACAVGVCSSSAMQGWWGKDDEASDKTDLHHEHADTPKLNSVPEWFEQKMLRNDTKFQAQTARANFCSFPIENVKDAQIETNSKFKLSKNMWLQTSDWHIPNSWAPRQQDEEGIDDKAKARKDKGT